MKNNFYQNLHKTALTGISATILSLLSKQQCGAEENLLNAMIYSCDGSGKCIRPLLVQAAGEMSHASITTLEHIGAVLEIIHSFSLIHDDLPCMDDDDYRRGKLSNHKVYGADIALLAGDALLVYAFEILTESSMIKMLTADKILIIINMITRAIGVHGMVGGQALDMMYTNQVITYEQLCHMHQLKTGKLIACACLIGYIAGNDYDHDLYQNLVTISADIGLLFQIVDDVLDVTASSAELGKTANKDADNNKATFVTMLGLEQAKKIADDLCNDIVLKLSQFNNSGYLQYLVKVIHKRNK